MNTADASGLSAAPMAMRAPLDAMSRIFLALGRHYNTNSNQILVVEGDLDFARLRAAMWRAVHRFPHLLHCPEGRR